MQDERLIECVRSREFLYNLSHPKYADAKYKAIAWKEIGDELNQPATACEKCWQNIRNKFRKYRAKENAVRSGQAADTDHQRKYRHWDALQFLLPHFHERELFSSIEAFQSFENRLEEGHAHCERDMQPQVHNKSRSQNEEQRQMLLKVVADCKELLQSMARSRTEAPPANLTSLQQFLMGIAVSASDLSKRHQSQLKRDIGVLLAEYELKECDEAGEA